MKKLFYSIAISILVFQFYSCKKGTSSESSSEPFSAFSRTVNLPYKILGDSGFSLSEQMVNGSVPFYLNPAFQLSDSFIVKYQIGFDSLLPPETSKYYAYARLALSDSCIAIIVVGTSKEEMAKEFSGMPGLAIFKLFTYDLSGKKIGELRLGKAFPDLDGNGITEYTVIDQNRKAKVYFSDGDDGPQGASDESTFDIYGLAVTRLVEAFTVNISAKGEMEPDGPDNEYSNLYTNDKKESINTFFGNLTGTTISSPLDYTKCSSVFSSTYKNAWFAFDATSGRTYSLIEGDSARYYLAATKEKKAADKTVLKEVFELPNASGGLLCLVYNTGANYSYEAYSYDSQFNPGRLVFVKDETSRIKGKPGSAEARQTLLAHYQSLMIANSGSEEE